MRLMDALSEMKCAIDDFARERDWEQFHTPANLAKSIAIESGELWNASNGMKTNSIWPR